MDKKRKIRRVKRQRTTDEYTQDENIEEIDIKSVLGANKFETVPTISNSDLIDVIKGNLKEFASDVPSDEDEVEGVTSSLCLTKAVIDAFSQSNVIDLVKHNLVAKLS